MKRSASSRDGIYMPPAKKQRCHSPEHNTSSQLQKQSTGFTSLPDEALFAIFSYLSLEDIALHIRSVCKHWKYLADREFLTNLYFNQHQSTQTVARIIRASPNLLSLVLEYRDDVDWILKGMVGSCGKMTQLVINGCRGMEFEISDMLLANITRKCERISDLTITDTQFRFHYFLYDMAHTLRRVNFSENRWFGGYALDVLLSYCSNMEVLWAEECMDDWLDSDMVRISQVWGGSLRVLKLVAPQVTDNGVAALSTCIHLQELSLTNLVNLTIDGLLQLKPLDKLTLLGLAGAELPPEDWCQAFVELPWTGQLEKLVLNGCSGVNARVLAHVSVVCPILEELHLWECSNVTDVAITAILHGCHWLHYLNVDCTDFSVSKCFPKIPVLAPQLQTLVYVPDFDEEDEKLVSNLKAALPSLDIQD